jgi:hypothetical protein
MSMLRTQSSEQSPDDVHVVHATEVPSTAGPLSAAWARTLGAAWLLIYVIGVATTPAPADSSAGPPLVVVLTGSALLGLLAVMAVGLVRRRRAGAWASLGGAGILLLDAVACPVSGHHEWTAGWSLFQLAGAVVLLGLSLRAVLSLQLSE